MSWRLLRNESSAESLVGVIIWSVRGRMSAIDRGRIKAEIILIDSLNVSFEAREAT